MNDDERIPGTNAWLGHIFQYDPNEEAEHRKALREAAKQARDRRRNYDQPWWAVNVTTMLDYIDCCERAIRTFMDERNGHEVATDPIGDPDK